MAVSTLSAADSLSGETRNITALILLNLLTAELALFVSSATLALSTVGILLISLLVSLFCGSMLSRIALIGRQPELARLCYGFLMAAGGLLLLLIALQNLHNVYLLLPGALLTGLGQGVAGGGLSRHSTTQHRGGLLLTALVVTMMASAALIIIVNRHVGISYAVALLTDLSLLGALYSKIVQNAPR